MSGVEGGERGALCALWRTNSLCQIGREGRERSRCRLSQPTYVYTYLTRIAVVRPPSPKLCSCLSFSAAAATSDRRVGGRRGEILFPIKVEIHAGGGRERERKEEGRENEGRKSFFAATVGEKGGSERGAFWRPSHQWEWPHFLLPPLSSPFPLFLPALMTPN